MRALFTFNFCLFLPKRPVILSSQDTTMEASPWKQITLAHVREVALTTLLSFLFSFLFFLFLSFFFFFFFFFFLRQVSLCSPDYPGAHSVDQSQPRIQRLACLYLMNAGESYFLSFFLKDLFVYLMFIGVLPLCTYIFMRVLDPLELELQTVVNCYVVALNH